VLTLEKAKEIGGRAYSFEYKGYTTNMGGPRAGLEGGRVDGLFARLGKEPGERGFFDEIKTLYKGDLIPLPELAFRGNLQEAGAIMAAAEEILESGDLSEYDAITAAEWITPRVTSREVMDVNRFSAIVMTTLPRLEDIAASAFFEAIRITRSNPRIYLAARGYGDFMRILAETSIENGGEVRTRARVDEILMEGDCVRGVVVKSGGGKPERIEAPLVIVALPIWELFEMVDESAFSDDFVAQVKHLDKKSAIFGITAALREPIYDGKFFVLTDGERCGYPISGFMASNVTPSLAPKDGHLLEVCCQCDFEIGDDRARLQKTIEHLEEDLETMFPGWREPVIWKKSYFHWEEPARNAGRAGVFRPASKAPGVEGLYFAGDTVASRALPGLECAADSALLCGQEILGTLPA
jgi:phytoene dehydrogenase-like protein